MAQYLWHVSAGKKNYGIVTVFRIMSLKSKVKLYLFLFWPFYPLVVGVESYWGTWSQRHTHTHTPTQHSVVILRTSDQQDAESTWQHTPFTIHRHPCSQRDSNPQFHRASGHRSRHYTDLSPGLANLVSHAQEKHRLKSSANIVVRMFDAGSNMRMTKETV